MLHKIGVKGFPERDYFSALVRAVGWRGPVSVAAFFFFFLQQPRMGLQNQVSTRGKHFLGGGRRGAPRGAQGPPGGPFLFFSIKILSGENTKRLHFRRQRILRPPLVSIVQDEADGDGFGAEFLLKT